MESWKRIFLKSVGFGAGFAVAAIAMLGIGFWWTNRPAKPKPWNSQAITSAGKSGIEAQVRGEVFHLEIKCDFKNNTDRDYTMPSDTLGTLMSLSSVNGGLEKINGVTWDTTAAIPSGRAVNVKFDIPYELSNYSQSSSSLADQKKFVDFADQRLKEVKDLKFFDNLERYEMDCPTAFDGN